MLEEWDKQLQSTGGDALEHAELELRKAKILELVEVSLLIYRFSFLFIVYNYFKRS
jgi:hypothetical protein